MTHPHELSHAYLLAVLNYDPLTGVFTRKVPYGRQAIGDVVGSQHIDGYLTIGVGGRSYTAARLAWFYAHGSWPTGMAKHKNRNRMDNRLENLEDAPDARREKYYSRPRKYGPRVQNYKQIKKLDPPPTSPYATE